MSFTERGQEPSSLLMSLLHLPVFGDGLCSPPGPSAAGTSPPLQGNGAQKCHCLVLGGPTMAPSLRTKRSFGSDLGVGLPCPLWVCARHWVGVWPQQGGCLPPTHPLRDASQGRTQHPPRQMNTACTRGAPVTRAAGLSPFTSTNFLPGGKKGQCGGKYPLLLANTRGLLVCALLEGWSSVR